MTQERDIADPDVASRRIALLIDDDPIIQELLAQYLRTRHGLRVLVASNGQEACRLLEHASQRVELAICDLNMPDCDGIEFIEMLQAKGIRLPIVFVTGARPEIAAAAQIIAKSNGQHVIGLLKKPVNLVKLSSLLSCLDAKQPALLTPVGA